jgi:hypothetical protein
LWLYQDIKLKMSNKLNKSIIRFVVALSFALVGIAVSLGPAHASSDPIDLNVSPPVTYLKIKPGTQHTLSFTLEQQGTLPLQITSKVVDFSPHPSGTGIVLNDSTSFPYLAFTGGPNELQQAMLLKPGEKRRYEVSLNIPAEAPEREYHLTWLFEAKPDSSFTIGEVGAQVSGTVGSNIIVLITNQDESRGQLQLKKFQLPTLVDSFSPVTFQLLAENTGPQALTASGSATITDWQGKVVKTFTFYPDTVLAQSSRSLRTLDSDQIPDQSTQPLPDPATPSLNPEFLKPLPAVAFTYDPPFLFGVYQVKVSMNNINTQNQSYDVQTSNFIAIPISIIIILALMLSAFIGFKYLLHLQRIQTNSPQLSN